MKRKLESDLVDAYSARETIAPITFNKTRLDKTRKLLIANAPPQQAGGFLLVVSMSEQPYWYHLSDKTIIGRTEEADLVLGHPWVSKKHCIIEFDGTDWEVRDTGSRNGVFINSERKEYHYLKEGDAVQIGSFLVIFVQGSAAVTT